MSLRRIALPRIRPWLLLLLVSFAIWIVVLETIIRPSAISLESTPMLLRLSWWLLPPLIFIFSLFTGQWALGSAKAEAAELKQQQESELLQRATAAKASEAAKAKSQQQFSLEIRSVGITVERFRQMAIWKQLDKTNHPLKSMLSQKPEDYEWAGEARLLQTKMRANNAFENALRFWVERWPIPVLVADSNGRGLNRVRWAQNGSGMSIHLFTALAAHQGEGSDKLVQQAFQYFDDHPELPAILLLSADSQEHSLDGVKDARFVPTLPDSIVAILLTRSDRVDQYLRPFAVDVPYNINMDKTQYDIIKLWNFYWDQKDTYRTSIPKSFDTMPTDYWNGEVKKLISQIDPNAAQGGMIPFWNAGKAGFQATPWLPVRWTKWQIEDEYDRAPIVGHLHRPVEIDLKDKNDAAKATAIAAGWQQALATLPDGSVPQWLFYDTGADTKQVIPFSRAMSMESTPQPLDFSDAAHSYNLSQRIGNTGVSSPFVQLGLGTMRSYHKGGVSATVNLRQPERASIIMISPPTAAEKAKNKPNPYNTNHANDPDPFVSKVM